MLKESFLMSWQNIISNKMRSFLTTLGIIIGVLSIITVVTIMNCASEKVSMEFKNLGAGKVTVSAPGTYLKKGLSPKDIVSVENINHVIGVSPDVSFSGTVFRDDSERLKVNANGKNDYYFRQASNNVSFGRAINNIDVESKNKVCVIDKNLQNKLFFGENPVGKNITINASSFQIIGVLDNSSLDLTAQLSFSNAPEYTVLIPYTTAMKVINNYSVSSMDIYIEDAQYTEQITSDIKKELNQAFNNKEGSFTVINLDSLIDSMKSITSMLSSILAGIASIALLVGGIGIMNMMLVSVNERTKEIGLKKALGAEPGRIQLQFLIESIMLSLLGGIIGLGLGILISWAVCSAIDMPLVISLNSILLAVGFSAGVGVIFGWAPARKASMLNPIDALRSE